MRIGHDIYQRLFWSGIRRIQQGGKIEDFSSRKTPAGMSRKKISGGRYAHRVPSDRKELEMCNITIFFPTDQTATKISVPLAGGPDGIRGREADTDKQNKNNMKVTIKTNFRFTVQGIEYTADREILLVLASSESGTDALHTYEVTK